MDYDGHRAGDDPLHCAPDRLFSALRHGQNPQENVRSEARGRGQCLASAQLSREVL